MTKTNKTKRNILAAVFGLAFIFAATGCETQPTNNAEQASEKTRGTCGELLATFERMWTFVDHEGVPPTNHFATGASEKSRTSAKGVSQDSRLACSDQNASRSASASA